MNLHEFALVLLGSGIAMLAIDGHHRFDDWLQRRHARRLSAAMAACKGAGPTYQAERALPAPVERLMCGGALLFSPESYPRIVAERRTH